MIETGCGGTDTESKSSVTRLALPVRRAGSVTCDGQRVVAVHTKRATPNRERYTWILSPSACSMRVA